MADKKETIRSLEILADEVKKLKSIHRQKHPIVIEFSGSPKSGKTSCINSLEIFLKRNGFSVHVVQERASVCPVTNKQSPMFNIWTSCMSLANMIGTLENTKSTVDVLILDRGVFDALCWFQWLYDTERMDGKLKKNTESFLLQKEFVQSIDILFAFKATPDVSIKREFANLLTTKTGTIMNERVLQEYLEAIEKTVKNHGNKFRAVDNKPAVIEIDTSSIGQDEVGREVTEKTLLSLREILMERIGYFNKTEKLMSILAQKTLFEYSELESQFKINRINFNLRNDIESNDNFLQIIPIAVVTNGSKEVLVAKKKNIACSEDSPEKNKTLLWFGGHTRISDCISEEESFLDICKSTLHRELKEELGISVSLDEKYPTIFYTPNNPRSSKHLAVCFIVEIDEATKLTIDPYELVQHRGTSKSGSFFKAEDLAKEDLEDWSILILKKFFNITTEMLSPQLSIDYVR